jgi:hypothetical protein
MNSLSVDAQNEIQAGRALPLEVALQRILQSVDEVLSYTIAGPKRMDGNDNSLAHTTLYFSCRFHGTFSVSLAMFCYQPGIVSLAMVDSMIAALKAHTDQTITFKR